MNNAEFKEKYHDALSRGDYATAMAMAVAARGDGYETRSDYGQRNADPRPPDHLDYALSTTMYFFQGYIDDYGDYRDLSIIDQVNNEMEVYGVSYKLSQAHGLWWGPVLPPWEQEP